MENPYAAPAVHDPVSAKSEEKQLEGIGGWLVLPAIGLVLGPIVGVILILMAAMAYPVMEQNGFGGLFITELVVSSLLVAFTIYAAVQFFGKKRSAPTIMIVLYSVGIAASVGLLMLELSAGAELFVEETVKGLIRDVVSAAVWIPYFRVSKRVKNTFVN